MKEITYCIDKDSFGWHSTFWFDDGTHIDDTFMGFDYAADAVKETKREAQNVAEEYNAIVKLIKFSTRTGAFETLATYKP